MMKYETGQRIIRSLQEGHLDVDQAVALLKAEQMDVGPAMLLVGAPHNPLASNFYAMESDRYSPPWLTLEVFWLHYGIDGCMVPFTVARNSFVMAFIARKMEIEPDLFTEAHLKRFDIGYDRTAIRKEVDAIRGRRLAATADRLLENPKELSRDVGEVKKRVAEYGFDAELNGVLDKVESGLHSGGDRFDQAALLKHLRTFIEKLHESVAVKLREAKPETVDGTDLTKFGHAVEYLARKDVLTEKMQALAKALYGILSNEGVHAITSERVYVRLCRNMVTEYALVLFFEFDRRIA